MGILRDSCSLHDLGWQDGDSFLGPLPATTPGYSQSMGTPPPGCGYLFILGGQLLPYNQVITNFAGRIGDNAGGEVQVVTASGAVNTTFFCMPNCQ